MRRLVLVDRASDAPAPRSGTDVVVLDAAWTPPPGDRSGLVPIRPIVQAIVDEVDVIDASLEALDAWAAASGMPAAFTIDGVTWWYRARMLLRWDAHELLLWRLVVDRLTARSDYDAIALPASRTALAAATTARAGATAVELIGADQPPVRILRGVRRRAARLFRRIRPARVPHPERLLALEQRLGVLSRERGGLLTLAWPRAFQVVADGDRERRVDPYLVGALDRLDAGGERVVQIGLSLDHRLDEDWAIVEADPRLLPERFLVERFAPAGPPTTESASVLEAVRRAGRVPQIVGGVDLAPSFSGLAGRYAGRWLDRQRRSLRAAGATLDALRPGAMLTDREGSRTAWLAAARRTGVTTVAIQHGMIYRGNPEYFQAPDPALVRPDVTCVFGDFERDLLVDEAGYDARAVVVTGSPRPLPPARRDDTGDRASVRAELGVDPGDRLLLVSVAHNEVLGELQTFGLLERTLGGPLPGVHLAIKLHPQDRAEPAHDRLLDGLAQAGAYAPARRTVVRDMDLYRLLGAADAHLGQYSTVLSDAVVAATPNMIAVGQAHADVLGYAAAGVAVPVRSVAEVGAFMADPQPPSAEARRRFLDAHYRAGDAAGRLADELRRAMVGRVAGAAPAGAGVRD